MLEVQGQIIAWLPDQWDHAIHLLTKAWPVFSLLDTSQSYLRRCWLHCTLSGTASKAEICPHSPESAQWCPAYGTAISLPKAGAWSKQLHCLCNGSDKSALPTSACDLSLFRNWGSKVTGKWPFFIFFSHLMHHIYPTLHVSEYDQHSHPLIEEELSRCHKTLKALLNDFPHPYKSVPCVKENFTYSFFQILSCKLWANASSCPALKKPFFPEYSDSFLCLSTQPGSKVAIWQLKITPGSK